MPLIPKPYTGKSKLVVAFDVGTTFSGISYCILERGQVPEINGVTRRALRLLRLIFLDNSLRFPGQPQVGGAAKVPSLLFYDKSGKVRAAGAEVLTESVIETAMMEEWTKAEWSVIQSRQGAVELTLIHQTQVEAPPPPEAFSIIHQQER